MQVKALVSFHAFNITARTGDILTISDRGVKADLEKLGWIEEIAEKKAKKTKSE